MTTNQSINLAYRIGQLATTPARAGLLPVSPATVWRWVRDGKFPKPFSLGPNTTVWDKAAVDQWLAKQKGGN
jgi:predicted DNA-binding transcriptional regulator AlpA